jgi:hypothetical protein
MEVIAFPLVSDVVAFTWTNFSAYRSETDFGSTANSDNEILLMSGNDSISASGSAYVSIVPCSSSANNGKFCVPNLLNISMGTTVTWINGELTSYKSFEVEHLYSHFWKS